MNRYCMFEWNYCPFMLFYTQFDASYAPVFMYLLLLTLVDVLQPCPLFYDKFLPTYHIISNLISSYCIFSYLNRISFRILIISHCISSHLISFYFLIVSPLILSHLISHNCILIMSHRNSII